MRMLSVDWDYFFPIPEYDPGYLYDWGHNENYGKFMLEDIWIIRAAAFLRNGLPLPDTSCMVKDFWSRFNLKDCTLFYADSHVNITKPEALSGISEIWNFDTHHDSYTPIHQIAHDMKVNCQNWAVGCYLMKVNLKTFYPSWASYRAEVDKPSIPVRIQIDNGQQFKRRFDRVFVCRSGAWTPTWLEDKFWRFVEECPAKKKVKLGNMERRQFSVGEVDKLIAQTNMLVQKGARYEDNLHQHTGRKNRNSMVGKRTLQEQEH